MTWINLWATWCAPCIAELNEFQASGDLLKAAGVKVVALSVDGLIEGGTSTDPAALAAKRAFSFATGRATPALVRRIERARAHAWGVKWALPVPSSVLVDGDGRLLVLYAGRVTPAQVAADARLAATSSPEAWHDAAMPFPGAWIERPNRPIALPLALDLMNEGALDDAQEFCGRAGTELSRHKEYAILLTWIGERLMERGSTAGALQAFESALAADADNVVVLNNLAWQRAAHPDAAVRDAAAAVRLAETAATLSTYQNASVLDTLAAAYAEAGRFKEAVATGEKALILATQSASPEVVQSITKGLGFYRRGRAYGR
jgi:tetratricopeptide (TPR) repeat protein